MAAKKGNQYAVGNSGKAKKFESVEDLEEHIQEYFDDCDSNTREVYDKKEQTIVTINSPLPYTIEGLALALGFLSREALLNYEKAKGYEEFFSTVKEAKLKVQNNKVSGLIIDTYSTAGTIFDLCNNHGYQQKMNIEQGGAVDFNINRTRPLKKGKEK